MKGFYNAFNTQMVCKENFDNFIANYKGKLTERFDVELNSTVYEDLTLKETLDLTKAILARKMNDGDEVRYYICSTFENSLVGMLLDKATEVVETLKYDNNSMILIKLNSKLLVSDDYKDMISNTYRMITKMVSVPVFVIPNDGSIDVTVKNTDARNDLVQTIKKNVEEVVASLKEMKEHSDVMSIDDVIKLIEYNF